MKILTTHKINKKDERAVVSEAILESESGKNAYFFPKRLQKHLTTVLQNKKLFIEGGILVIASLGANVLNYIFNTYAARTLTFSDFSLIGLIGAFLSLASILFGAYTLAINYCSSFLIGKYGNGKAYNFWLQMSKKAFIPSLCITGVWLLLSPLLMNYFHVTTIALFFLFGFVLLMGLNNSINQGFLSAKLLFGPLAIISVIDPVIRLAGTFGLVSIGKDALAYATMILSFVLVTAASFLLLKLFVTKEKVDHTFSATSHFSKKLFFLAVISGFSSVAYFTFDIFLAKHYLSPTLAGEYVLVSLIGKMVFFFGNLMSPFITPIVSRYEGAGKSSLKPLYVLLGITAIFSFFAFILLGVFGSFTLPILYGHKALVVLPVIPLFTFGMACYSISGVLVNYYLIKKVYSFTMMTSLLVVAQVILISLFHTSVQSIAMVMSLLLIANLLVTLGMHFSYTYVSKLEKKVVKVLHIIERQSMMHALKTVQVKFPK